MTGEYTISEDQSVIRVLYMGQTSYETSSNMMRDVAEVIARTGLKKLLFDIRDAKGTGSYALPIQHVEEAPSMGFTPMLRSAIIGAPKDQVMLKYIEDVSVNRGMQVRTFTDEEQALSWLLSE